MKKPMYCLRWFAVLAATLLTNALAINAWRHPGSSL